MNLPQWDRRQVLQVAGAIGLAGSLPRVGAAEPPPETRRIRLPRYPVDVACISPMWIAEELLRAEGFEEIAYVPAPMSELSVPQFDVVKVGAGEHDFTSRERPSRSAMSGARRLSRRCLRTSGWMRAGT